VVFEEQRYAPGYSIKSFSAITNDTLYDLNYWTPNSTLILGGDTTLIFYYIGWVFRTQPSDDPIFATNQSLVHPVYGTLYKSRGFVSPIICDTTYQLCVDHGRDCSPVGPMTQVLNWMNETKGGDVWDDIGIFFYASTTTPPIYRASYGSGAVASTKTLANSVQSDGVNNTAAQELGRLSQAGMTTLASGTQLAAVGYWGRGSGSAVTPPHQFCNNVIIKAANTISILLTPYWVFLSVTAVVVALSYADRLGAKKMNRWKKYADPWALYSVGQLHRQVAEHGFGRLSSARPRKRWPNLRSGRSGLDIVEKHGSMYLAPGAYFYLYFYFISIPVVSNNNDAHFDSHTDLMRMDRLVDSRVEYAPSLAHTAAPARFLHHAADQLFLRCHCTSEFRTFHTTAH
jgi:hypothetical protein